MSHILNRHSYLSLFFQKEAQNKQELKEKYERLGKPPWFIKTEEMKQKNMRKNFQRNSDHDMEEKFWKTFTKIQSDKILKVTEKLRLNVYSPFYFLPSYKYSILKFYVISKTMQNYACLFQLWYTFGVMIRCPIDHLLRGRASLFRLLW